MFQIFKSLQFCHQNNILNRDLRPSNILFDPNNKKLEIIDWSIADFYDPTGEMNTNVCSRPYKSPELLLNYNHYDFSMDIWSAGCIMGSMIFKKEYLFFGKSDQDQLKAMLNIYGYSKYEKLV